MEVISAQRDPAQPACIPAPKPPWSRLKHKLRVIFDPHNRKNRDAKRHPRPIKQHQKMLATLLVVEDRVTFDFTGRDMISPARQINP